MESVKVRQTPVLWSWWDLPLAPLIWLERARGWKRFALALLYLIVLAVVGVSTWRAFSLNDLPDVGDPFELTEFDRLSVSDERNAYVLYREAEKALGRVGPHSSWNYPDDWDEHETDWSLANRTMKQWVVENRETLRLLIEGTGRPESMGPPSWSLADSKPIPEDIWREFFILITLEGSRRFHNGNLTGAWEAYQALLRSTRHFELGNGSIFRLIAKASVRQAMGNMNLWMLDPRVTPPMLRGAIQDVRAAVALTPPASQAVKVDYILIKNRLAEPGLKEETIRGFKLNRYDTLSHLPGLAEVTWFLSREPERSLRITRLYHANWLSQCDLPPADRARFSNPSAGTFALYRTNPADPRHAPGLNAEVLNQWIERSFVSGWELLEMSSIQGLIDADRQQLVIIRESLETVLKQRTAGARHPE